jgi:hypothetical protein
METLIKNAIQNENNQPILSLTYKKIEDRKYSILSELKLLSLRKKLKEYRHVDELQEFQIGRFIRWINLSTKTFVNGGFIVRINIHENGTVITCKNPFNAFYTLKVDECIIFQKITQQEHVLLAAMEHLTL